MFLGLFICLWGFSVCFKLDFIFKHVSDPFPNGSCLKHDMFYIEDYKNFLDPHGENQQKALLFQAG